MSNKADTPIDKKAMNRAKSCNSGQPAKPTIEPSKQKSFNENDAVKTLDIALGRLKKSKLVNGPYTSSTAPASPVIPTRDPSDVFMNMSSPGSNMTHSLDNASLMSMNFSHYELMRNLSHSTSNSEGACSGATCDGQPADRTVKNEHLERYFRSVDVWSRKSRQPNASPNSVHFEIPEK